MNASVVQPEGVRVGLKSDGLQPDVAQRKASDPAASIWVGASAGSGKTKVLADRVIRLLLAGVLPQRILCLTFTKAAAAEMAIRITRQLAKWATCDDDTLRGELDKLQNRPPEPEQLDNARRLFARVLSCPGGMRIRTIHAFGQEILRRFPVEAGLAPHFVLLDEADAHALRLDAQADVLQAASAAPQSPEGKALDKLVRDIGEESFANLLKEAVQDMPRLNAAISHAGGFKKLIAAMRGLLDLGPKETEDSIRREAMSDKALPRKDILHAARLLAEKGSPKTHKPRGQAMLEWLALPKEEAVAAFDKYMRAFLTKEGEAYAKAVNAELQKTNPEIEAAIANEAFRLERVLERLESARMAEQTEAVLTLAVAVAGRYEKRKKARASLDYDDLIRRTDELLRREGIAPWVLYKLDGGVDHILLDEAQDTNPDQWRIVDALTEEFFSGRGSREDIHRTLFVVGDEKQAIYSFLKADPDEFQRMREHFRARIMNAERAYGEVPLNISFRSAPAVLRAVDKVFEDELTRQGVSREAVRHAAFHREAAGRVEVWPLIPAPEKDKAEFALPVHYETERNPVVELAEQIAQRIDNWHRQGLRVYDRKAKQFRPMTYNDVMILVRKRKPFVEPLVRALKQQRVPVTGADRMMLTQQLAVMDLVALLQFMLLPDDDLNLATVLRGPLLGCSEEQLMELAIGRKGTLWESLGDKGFWAREYLEKCLAVVDEVTPFALLARVLSEPCPADEVSGRRAILKRLGPDALDPIDELLNAAQQFGMRHTPSLQAFLHWLMETEAEVKREMDQGAGQVRIVTVHAAKGLEAPIVILPDAASVPKTNDLPKILWHKEHQVPFYVPRIPQNALVRGLRDVARQKQLEEYRRLLYVAMTRAADHIYVGGWETSKQEGGAESWYDIALTSLKDLHEPSAVEEDSVVVPEVAFADPIIQESFPRKRESSASDSEHTSHTARGRGPLDPRFRGDDKQENIIELPSWALQKPEEEPEPPRPLTPSRPDDEEPPIITPNDARFARGIIIHRLLQSLPEMSAEKQETTAKRYLANPQHRLTQEQQQEIMTEVFALLRHVDFAPLFGKDSRAEVPIVGIVNDRVIAGQVDRLCVRGDEVWIVDYKTNRPPPADASGVAPIYVKQLAAYREVLRVVYPQKTVRTFLLWTFGARLMEIK